MNLEPRTYEVRLLTIELWLHLMEEVARFELARRLRDYSQISNLMPCLIRLIPPDGRGSRSRTCGHEFKARCLNYLAIPQYWRLCSDSQ